MTAREAEAKLAALGWTEDQFDRFVDWICECEDQPVIIANILTMPGLADLTEAFFAQLDCAYVRVTLNSLAVRP